MTTIKVNSWVEIPIDYTGIAEWSTGSKYWFKNGKYHRLGGPAIEFSIGRKEWWLEHQEYSQINLKDFIILDHYKGKFAIMWYKLLDKDEIFEYPDIPGLIIK